MYRLLSKSLIYLLGILSFTGLFGQTTSLTKVNDLTIYMDTAFYSAFPSIIKTQDEGFLLAFRRAPDRRIFQEGSNSHVDPNSYLVMMRSEDGLAWNSDPKLLYAHPFGGSQDPCLIQLKDGGILCASYGWARINPDGVENLKKPFAENRKGFIFLGGYLVHSKDGGSTWEGPVYPPSVEIEHRYDALGRSLPAYNRGAMCEGKDGRLFWVVAATPENGKTTTHLMISEDQGTTWKYSCPVAVDDRISFNEASIHETPGGDLVVFLRTAGNGDQACYARSTDGGKSFEPWQEMGFKGHPFHALELSDGQVLLSYGYRHIPYGIRARLLNPECTNISIAPEVILREDGGSTDLGYPWSAQISENEAIVVYYFNKDKGTRHIAGTVVSF